MNQQLADLIDTLIATDQYPTSWAWNAAEDGPSAGAYMDCSAANTSPFSESFNLEIGDGDDVIVIGDLDVTELQEIHRKLTLQLAVVMHRRSRA